MQSRSQAYLIIGLALLAAALLLTVWVLTADAAAPTTTTTVGGTVDVVQPTAQAPWWYVAVRLDGGTQPRAELDAAVVSEWAAAFRMNSWDPLSPRSLFSDVTYIHALDLAERVQGHCLKQGAIPLIQQDPATGAYVFHTLFLADGTVSRKAIAKRFNQQAIKSISSRERRDERSIEVQLAHELRQAGHTVNRQQRCGVGVADIVTEEALGLRVNT